MNSENDYTFEHSSGHNEEENSFGGQTNSSIMSLGEQNRLGWPVASDDHEYLEELEENDEYEYLLEEMDPLSSSLSEDMNSDSISSEQRIVHATEYVLNSMNQLTQEQSHDIINDILEDSDSLREIVESIVNELYDNPPMNIDVTNSEEQDKMVE